MMFVTKRKFDAAMAAIHSHLNIWGRNLMEDIAGLKAAADATVADLADLRSKVAALTAQLANLPPPPADNTQAIADITKELQDAVAIDAPAAPPTA
jgi:hypothetical protein